MKFVRFLDGGIAVPGIVRDGGIVPLAELMPDVRTIREVAADPAILATLADKAEHATPSIDLATAKLLAPIERPGKYLAIGMNYRKHAEEARALGIAVPDGQVWFNKQTTCISGPFDDIDPGVTEKLDYEVELGVVIGQPARRVGKNEAPGHVFGYFVANDVSARDWQFHSNTITMGKSFDTHGPVGPWIVTADEIPDPHALTLRCFVNGELRQESNTADLIFNIWDQIEYLSTAFTLETGDFLITGTPAGVGVAMQPPSFLQPGDVVRCEVEGIGAIENSVRRS